MKVARTLSDLGSVGPAMVRDFQLLGITRVEQLVGRDPEQLYHKLCGITGSKQDICVLDVFRCAVAQAENPELSAEKRQWFYWSRVRKGQIKPRRRG